jgi:hypothetical protein
MVLIKEQKAFPKDQKYQSIFEIVSEMLLFDFVHKKMEQKK